VRAGERANRDDLPHPPAKPKPIGDPDRIKEIVQLGKTYRAIVTGAMNARTEDEDWGVKAVTNMGFRFEMVVNRTIEGNDGKRITELREFETVRCMKVLSEVASVDVGPLSPGMLVLGVLDLVDPGAGVAVAAVTKPLMEGFLQGAIQAGMDNYKAFAKVDSLSGKKVRIVYVDGVGVESVQPVGCDLTADEKDFIFCTATLSDYHVMPDLKIKVGGTWSVDGRQLVGFLDPSLRGVPRGEIVLVRDADHEQNGKTYATLRVKSGEVVIDSSNAAKRSIGSFVPRGQLRYNISDGCVETANLGGDIVFEEVSQDHIFYKASFISKPRLDITYSCTMK